MTFQEIELIASKKEPISKTQPYPDQACYISLRSLYSEYRKRMISKQDASKEKQNIKAWFMAAQLEYIRYTAAYAQYQENIRRAGELLAELTKASANNPPLKDLFDLSLDLISSMIGETVTASTIRNNLKKGVSEHAFHSG